MTTTDQQSVAPVRTQLLRILGAGFGVAVVLGATIGVGILRLPGTVAAALGNYWLVLLSWIIGGAYALLGAVSVAELGAMLPQAGGFYVFAKRAFGGFTGFAVGWGDWVNNCATLAYASAAAAEYCVELFPRFAGHEKTIAVATLGFFVALHAVGLRLSSFVQKITSAATAIALIGLAAGCFFVGSGSRSLETGSAGSIAGALNFHGSWLLILAPVVIALRAIVVAYDGWYEAIYFLEEDVNPAINLPRALIGGVLLIVALYLVMNAALLHVLPIRVLAASKLPAAAAAQILFGGWSGRIITILSLMTLLSLINAVLLGATRIIFAISRDGLISNVAARVSAKGTPQAALLLSAGTAVILVASGTFERIISIAAVVFVANYCATYAAVIWLRHREPNAPRPFRAWGYPWSTGIVLAGSGLFLVAAIASAPMDAVFAAGLLGVCAPVYVLMKKPPPATEV
jgi:basic amino acid/polyamine antiporter, APA family